MNETKEYEIGQWFRCGEKTGHIIEKDLDTTKRGYLMEWVTLINPIPAGTADRYSPLRSRWIRPESLADKRYQPIGDPMNPDTAFPQASLPLSERAAMVAFLRAARDAGKLAEDQLRAMGEAA